MHCPKQFLLGLANGNYSESIIDLHLPENRYKAHLRRDGCSYCGKSTMSAQTWDHVIPVSNGGDKRYTNQVSACGGCNSRKGSRSVLFFILKALK